MHVCVCMYACMHVCMYATHLPVYDPLSPRVTKKKKPAPAVAACSIRAELLMGPHLRPHLAEASAAAPAPAVAVGVASCVKDRLSRCSSKGCTVQLAARTHRFACTGFS